MARRKKDRTDELLAELVKGKSPGEILGEGGVLRQLTKRLVENALCWSKPRLHYFLGAFDWTPTTRNTSSVSILFFR